MSEHFEQEIYIEPTPLRRRDTVGIVIALIALAVIGVSGYVWLNPQLSIKTLFAGGGKPAIVQPQTPSSTDSLAADVSDEHQSCPYCGMFADKSRSAVAVMWKGGGSNTFDAFDCLFNYEQENDVKLESATVKNYKENQDPEWVDTKAAVYLYATTAIVEGSMQPYVAAFTSRTLAEEAQVSMGGEVMNFVELESKWKEPK